MIKTNKILLKGNTSSLLKSYLLGGSIVDYMKSLNMDSSKTNRAKLAKEYGIENYSGTAELNMKLLKLLKAKYLQTNITPSQQNTKVQKTQAITPAKKDVIVKKETVQNPKKEPSFFDKAVSWGRNVYNKIEDTFNEGTEALTRISSEARTQELPQIKSSMEAKVADSPAATKKPSIPIRTSQGAYAPVQYLISDKHATKVVNKAKEIADSNAGRFVSNMVTHPIHGLVDGTLWAADVVGLPSNITTYVRDLNVSIPYRGKAYASAVYNAAKNGTDVKTEYDYLISNPNGWMDYSITPLTNTNANFSEAELEEIKKMAGDKYYITSADIARASDDGKYGGKGTLVSKVTNPNKVVLTTLGLTTGDAKTKTITDIYDFNNKTEKDLADNRMYENMEGSFGTYEGLRAWAPKINTTNQMPNKYKIQTKLQF